jgi:phosphoglycolate phosphatase
MYEQSGFDFAKDSYEDIAERWIQIYHTYPNPPKLHDDTVPVLEAFQEKGARQAILSALPHAALEKAVAHHGIDHFFEAVRGAVDVFGHGKVLEGVQLARHVELAGADITIVGDSTHDAEVAQELGARCYLVSLGAESERRLLETGFPVCGSLSDVYRQVHGHTQPTIP